MLKQIVLPIIGVALFIAIVGWFVKNASNLNIPGAIPKAPVNKTVTIKGKTIAVEIPESQDDKAKGLSGRSSLNENSGMLFKLDNKKIQGFWMKDMLIPIDIIWIKNNSIISIDKNAEPPPNGTPTSALRIYSSSEPADYVLEVNSGFSDKNNIHLGDKVDINI